LGATRLWIFELIDLLAFLGDDITLVAGGLNRWYMEQMTRN